MERVSYYELESLEKFLLNSARICEPEVLEKARMKT